MEQHKQGLSSLSPLLILKHTFHTLSLTLLSLLLPLSFLILSKLTSSLSIILPSPFPYVLHFVVSLLSISSLLYSLTGTLLKPKPPISWAFLITFQVCVSIGIESTISSIKPTQNLSEVSYAVLVERVIFSLGLYDTMLYWMRGFVKPVVDDTVYGFEEDERKVDRAAIGAAFSGLWVWILRGEVKTLVLVGGKGGRVAMEGKQHELLVWLVSYTTLVIGMVKVVEVIFWVGSWTFCCFWRGGGGGGGGGVEVDCVGNADQV